MNKRIPLWLFYVGFVYTLVVPTVAVVCGKEVQESTLLFVVGVAAMLFVRLSDLESVQLFGLPAKLRTQVAEAEAVLEQLRHLAIGVAAPALTNLATLDKGKLQNRMYVANATRWQIEKRDEVNASLRAIGLPEQTISQANENFDRFVESGLADRVLQNAAVGGGIEEAFSIDVPQQAIPSAASIREYLKSRSIELTSHVESSLEELAYFQKHRIVQNPDSLVGW